MDLDINSYTEEALIFELKKLFQETASIETETLIQLKEYLTEDYALLGIIGLLIESYPHCLLGQKQIHDKQIKEWCKKVEVDEKKLNLIAQDYLTKDLNEVTETVYRKVMLEYPKKN